MECVKPLEMQISALGVLPSMLVSAVIAICKINERVEVEETTSGLFLRTVWEEDEEKVLHKLREVIGGSFKTSKPRVVYRHERALMEPKMSVRVFVPEDCVGNVFGDINRRRGMIQGMDGADNGMVIRAIVPLAELLGYPTDLRVMTQGTGRAEVEFFAYEPAPSNHNPDPDPDEPASAALRA